MKSTFSSSAPSLDLHQEGVIQFEMNHQTLPLDFKESKTLHQWEELNHWRMRLKNYDLIGQDPLRYEGCGFGNVSMRYPQSASSFLITGSQTGGQESLSLKEYCWITECNFQQHLLHSRGQILPSSESMTHGMMYQLDPKIQAVFHIHCPLIWNHPSLELPTTSKEAGYGTVDMVNEVKLLYQTTHLSHFDSITIEETNREKNTVADLPRGALKMGGHEDGILCFGRTLEEAGWRILNLLKHVQKEK